MEPALRCSSLTNTWEGLTQRHKTADDDGAAFLPPDRLRSHMEGSTSTNSKERAREPCRSSI